MALPADTRAELKAKFEEWLESQADVEEASEELQDAIDDAHEAEEEAHDDPTPANIEAAAEAAVEVVEAEAELAEAVATEEVAEAAAVAAEHEVVGEAHDEAAVEAVTDLVDDGGAVPPSDAAVVDEGPGIEVAGAEVSAVVEDVPPPTTHPYYRPFKGWLFGRQQ